MLPGVNSQPSNPSAECTGLADTASMLMRPRLFNGNYTIFTSSQFYWHLYFQFYFEFQSLVTSPPSPALDAQLTWLHDTHVYYDYSAWIRFSWTVFSREAGPISYRALNLRAADESPRHKAWRQHPRRNYECSNGHGTLYHG